MNANNLPRRRDTRHSETDPYRRLLGAVAMLAAKDLVYPPKSLSIQDHSSALQFVRENSDLYNSLGISRRRYNAVLQEVCHV